MYSNTIINIIAKKRRQHIESRFSIPATEKRSPTARLSADWTAHLVVLGDQDARAAGLQRHLRHGPEHVRLHGEGELQAQVADVVVQDPLQVLGVLGVDGGHVLVVHRDA